jgi:hypothetical protein
MHEHDPDDDAPEPQWPALLSIFLIGASLLTVVWWFAGGRFPWDD